MPNFEETIEGSNAKEVQAAIRLAGSIADLVFDEHVKAGGDVSEPAQIQAFASKLSRALFDSEDKLAVPAFSIALAVDALALKATVCFLEGGLFKSMVRFLGDAQGSFGLSCCCTLDRHVACIASRGQAMCISFNPEAGAVLWGSESASQVPSMSTLQDVLYIMP